MIKITVDNVEREIEEGSSLLMALVQFSPYGEESTICVYNGVSHKSIDDEVASIILNDGDKIEIYPLVIGG